MIDFDAVIDVPAAPIGLAVPEYLPPVVDPSRHRIALIGCGGISALQLAAYRRSGFTVSLLCDRTAGKAAARRDEFFPTAQVTDSVADVAADPGIDIVDVATHVDGRADVIRALLRAGKNVLSQKPFVLDLDEGQDLINLAAGVGRLLAVNHNGRWAPHFAVALASVTRGDVGAVTSADFDVFWPHDQIVAQEPTFATMFDLMVYDFGIHWFDIVAQLMPHAGTADVYATARVRPGQLITAPTQLDVIIEYPAAVATVRFRGSSPRAESGSFRIEGTEGTIRHTGTSLGGNQVHIEGAAGSAVVDLEGGWWTNGMTGTMAEVMAALDDDRGPRNSAASSLSGLALCFAAMQSIRTHQSVAAGSVHKAPFDGR